MYRCGPLPDLITHSAVISTCERAHRWEQAVQLLADMWLRSVLPDVVICSAVVSACAKGQTWQRALRLVAEMQVTWSVFFVSLCWLPSYAMCLALVV